MERLFGFQNLRVWQKAHVLVLEIYRLTRNFPSDERFCLVNQIWRSSISICANISEGSLKSKKNFSRYLDIANGSLEETKYHLILSKDLQYITLSQFENLLSLANQVGRMLYCLNQKVGNNTL